MRWMYCYNCKNIFLEEDIISIKHEECHWWLDDKPTEVYYECNCPYCKSDDMEECNYCDICGEPIPPDKHDTLCEVCIEEGY